MNYYLASLTLFVLPVGLFLCYQFVRALIESRRFARNAKHADNHPGLAAMYFYNMSQLWRSRFNMLANGGLLIGWFQIFVAVTA